MTRNYPLRPVQSGAAICARVRGRLTRPDAMGFSATDAAALRPYADNVVVAGVKSKPELNGKLGMTLALSTSPRAHTVLVEGSPRPSHSSRRTSRDRGCPRVVSPFILAAVEMPQQDQKPTAKAEPRRRKHAAEPEPGPEPEPEPEPSEKRRRKRVAKEDDDEVAAAAEPSEKRRRKRVVKEDDDKVAELNAEAERFCSQGATPVNAAAEAEEEEEGQSSSCARCCGRAMEAAGEEGRQALLHLQPLPHVHVGIGRGAAAAQRPAVQVWPALCSA